MNFRKATPADWDAMMEVRLAVKENVLVNTGAVTEEHYLNILNSGGCGWMCEEEGDTLGFAIVDLASKNIWALFVHPDHEHKGVGATLHQLMLDWSFENGADWLYLSTDPGTRAEIFYLKAGWEYKGLEENGELRFEITKEHWRSLRQRNAESAN
ncbi:GNAT family N-acetyltransferase [Pontibacter locisalis]|uniref:GNAT family N-acetyltransferase n=1 Tax=Pontibacter locisalis TaxID=1719035 RepID=A0ABW5IHZ8_9BACT